jgi:hypothetical protein
VEHERAVFDEEKVVYSITYSSDAMFFERPYCSGEPSALDTVATSMGQNSWWETNFTSTGKNASDLF